MKKYHASHEETHSSTSFMMHLKVNKPRLHLTAAVWFVSV
jgi:hypothetical protein